MFYLTLKLKQQSSFFFNNITNFVDWITAHWYNQTSYSSCQTVRGGEDWLVVVVMFVLKIKKSYNIFFICNIQFYIYFFDKFFVLV